MSIPRAAPLGFSPHDHAGCVRSAIVAAKSVCADRGLRLTPSRRRVLEILLEDHAARGAYDILRRLERDGHGAQPPVAYRALSFLIEAGFAHRIERLNAYVACARPGTEHDPAFLICSGCGAVAEAEAAPIAPTAARAGFRIEDVVLEVRGLCADCQTRESGL